jgi:hypothetical protein
MNRYDPGVVKVMVVERVVPAGMVTSVGRDPWTGSVPVRCRSWTAASPTMNSWSIGSSLRSTNVTATPAGTLICDWS